MFCLDHRDLLFIGDIGLCLDHRDFLHIADIGLCLGHRDILLIADIMLCSVTIRSKYFNCAFLFVSLAQEKDVERVVQQGGNGVKVKLSS